MTTETEYIRITNRVKISTALNILRDVMGGNAFGIPEEDLKDILQKLSFSERRLFGSFEIDVEGEGNDL